MMTFEMRSCKTPQAFKRICKECRRSARATIWSCWIYKRASRTVISRWSQLLSGGRRRCMRWVVKGVRRLRPWRSMQRNSKNLKMKWSTREWRCTRSKCSGWITKHGSWSSRVRLNYRASRRRSQAKENEKSLNQDWWIDWKKSWRRRTEVWWRKNWAGNKWDQGHNRRSRFRGTAPSTHFVCLSHPQILGEWRRTERQRKLNHKIGIIWIKIKASNRAGQCRRSRQPTSIQAPIWSRSWDHLRVCESGISSWGFSLAQTKFLKTYSAREQDKATIQAITQPNQPKLE